MIRNTVEGWQGPMSGKEASLNDYAIGLESILTLADPASCTLHSFGFVSCTGQ